MHWIITIVENTICHKLYFHSHPLISLPSTMPYEVMITILIWKILAFIFHVSLQPVVQACNYNLQTNIKTINVMGAVWVLMAQRSKNVTTTYQCIFQTRTYLCVFYGGSGDRMRHGSSCHRTHIYSSFLQYGCDGAL